MGTGHFFYPTLFFQNLLYFRFLTFVLFIFFASVCTCHQNINTLQITWFCYLLSIPSLLSTAVTDILLKRVNFKIENEKITDIGKKGEGKKNGDIPLVWQPLFGQPNTPTTCTIDSPLLRQPITPTAHYSDNMRFS